MTNRLTCAVNVLVFSHQARLESGVSYPGPATFGGPSRRP